MTPEPPDAPVTPGERAQYLVARALSRLPARVQVALAGGAPVRRDGLALDPQLQLIRAIRARRGHRGLVEPTVEVGRRRFRRECLVFNGPRTPVGAVRDLAVDDGAGPRRARHYAPPGDDGAPAPLLVYLHGGGFTIGDLDTHDEPCRVLCAHARTHVLSVDYRLAPEHPFPAGLDDALAALAWARAHAASLGADATRIAVGGDSAGGNLAAVVARLATAGGTPPLAQLLVYPATDMSRRWPSYDLFDQGFFLDAKDRDAFRRLYAEPSGTPLDDPRLSPLRAAPGELAALPPAMVVTAGFDALRDEGEAYAAALAAAGVEVRARRFDGLGHGFIHMGGVSPTAHRALREVARDWRALVEHAARAVPAR